MPLFHRPSIPGESTTDGVALPCTGLQMVEQENRQFLASYLLPQGGNKRNENDEEPTSPISSWVGQ
jgi:hypothetical protein